MKIKIFYLHKDIENYENEINKFIKNKTKNIFWFIGLEHDCFDIGNYKIIA